MDRRALIVCTDLVRAAAIAFEQSRTSLTRTRRAVRRACSASARPAGPPWRWPAEGQVGGQAEGQAEDSVQLGQRFGGADGRPGDVAVWSDEHRLSVRDAVALGQRALLGADAQPPG